MDENTIYETENEKLIFEHLYTVGGYSTYEIYVMSGKFSGRCSICISRFDLRKIIKTIKVMTKSLSGEIAIDDCESDSYLKLYFDNKLNHNLFVKGQLGGSHQTHMLIFEFKADQTILLRFNKILSYGIESGGDVRPMSSD